MLDKGANPMSGRHREEEEYEHVDPNGVKSRFGYK
jgi:hypothetical protein